jgi:asparagine synthase (glutamine-hydrolysing)
VYRENRPREEHVVWRPAYPDRSSTFPLTLEGAARELRERLLKATELRIVRADVPVGSYLSGGIDSSLTAWMGRQAKQGDFRTYAIRFADAEFDETPYQRAMAATLESTHEELVVTRGDIARVFPAVIRHTERPVLRTAAAPLFLLSGLVHDSGIKAVLTGEGADEMFGGYDIFREAKIREFWSHQPASTARPRLFDRLYPYLARSPQQARGMALEFWKKGLETAGQPGFSHQPRWSTTAMLKKFFAPQVRDAVADRPAPNVLDSLPPEFARWESLAQAQYLEVVTLLSGYLLSSQGDRMLMAHSVEGRFPFLDAEVMAFANSLPEGYKLAGLTEKAILKRVAADVLPEIIVRRQKQPYRAPDAISFVEPGAPAYVEEVFSESGLRATGLFEPRMVRGLYAKCRERAAEHHGDAVFSNTDNMALVGILSTELLVREVLGAGAPAPVDHVQTMIDRIAVPTHSPT